MRDKSIGRRAAETLASLRQKRDASDADRRRADEIVDAYFDRELSPDESRAFFDVIRSNETARRDFDATQRALDALREPVDAPDLSASILAEVGRRRGWLPGRLRQYVTFGRVSIAACFLLLLTGAFMIERESPGALTFTEPEAPLTNLVQTSRDEASVGIQQISSAVETLRKEQAAKAECSGEVRYEFCSSGSARAPRTFVTKSTESVRVYAASDARGVSVMMRGALREGDKPVTVEIMMPVPTAPRFVPDAEAPAALRGIDD